MCGPGWVVSIFCRSMMVMCIPRVLRVSALRLWCVKMGFVGNGNGGSVMWGLSWVGCLRAGVWKGIRVTWGVGMDFGSSSSIWGWIMGMSGVRLRPCVVGEGFHALHWKMLSWFRFSCWM